MVSCSDSDENENHSCEDEELVISPEPRTNQAPSQTAAVEPFALQAIEDPYQSRQNDLMIFATNEERNADLLAGANRGKEKYSSLEDGEVRDDDDDSAGEDTEAARSSYANSQPAVIKRVSESEILDEDNFFYGGGDAK